MGVAVWTALRRTGGAYVSDDRQGPGRSPRGAAFALDEDGGLDMLKLARAFNQKTFQWT